MSTLPRPFHDIKKGETLNRLGNEMNMSLATERMNPRVNVNTLAQGKLIQF